MNIAKKRKPAPKKNIPFSRGLDKIPRRYHGWLMLTCVLMAILLIVFGYYAKGKQPEKPYSPYIVTPRQVSGWLKQERNLLLVELSRNAGEAPFLHGAVHVGPIAYDVNELKEQARAFLSALPSPRPWVICYSPAPDKNMVSAFLGELNKLEVPHIYALAGDPEKWLEYGLAHEQAQEPAD